MKKSLRFLLLTGVFAAPFAAKSAINATHSAADFQKQYEMKSALDVALDVNQEQLDFSHHPGKKKAQQFIHGMTKQIQSLMREIETTIDAETDLVFPSWVDAFAKAERVRMSLTKIDPNNTGGVVGSSDHIDNNTSANITIKFHRKHHIPHLDDVTIRLAPRVSISHDGEYSIQAWYCVTDVDWVQYARDWHAPAENGSEAKIGQAVKRERSMLLRNLPYPWSHCVVSDEGQHGMEMPASDAADFAGIGASDITE